MPEKQKLQERYKSLIDVFLQKNSELNLSAIRTPEEVFEKHILDSLELCNIIRFKPNDTVLDLGTGGGFPGIPLAMNFPETRFTLLDATRKKIEAVQDIVKQLDLKNIKTIWARAEELKGIQFDYVVARAVTFLPQLIGWSEHLVKEGGMLFAYKLPSLNELGEGKLMAQKMGMDLVQEYNYKINDTMRVIWVFKKTVTS